MQLRDSKQLQEGKKKKKKLKACGTTQQPNEVFLAFSPTRRGQHSSSEEGHNNPVSPRDPPPVRGRDARPGAASAGAGHRPGSLCGAHGGAGVSAPLPGAAASGKHNRQPAAGGCSTFSHQRGEKERKKRRKEKKKSLFSRLARLPRTLPRTLLPHPAQVGTWRPQRGHPGAAAAGGAGRAPRAPAANLTVFLPP